MKLSKFLYCLSVLFSFITILNISGQSIKAFSLDSAEFNQQIDAFFKSNLTQDDKLFIDRFITLWNGMAFEKDEYIRIQKNLNKLLEFNLSPSPDYTKYLQILIHFIEKEKSPSLLKRWQEVFFDFLCQEKVLISSIKNFLKFSDDFIYGNYIFNSGTLQWKATGIHYQFYFKETFKVEFFNTDLECYAKRDSIKIYQTKGTLFPLEYKWEGSKGIVTWERSGYSFDSVHAELSNYTIFVNKSEYTADSVLFTNKYYFSEIVLGKLFDKVTHVTSNEKVLYPQFTAYDNNYHWSEMYPNIDYDGGFSFQGSRIAGHTNTGEEVVLSLKYNDTLIMRIKSKFIVFYPDRLLSNNASVSIYLKTDSIYHPDIYFNYYVRKQEILFTRNEDFLSQSPYVNTYHQVLMSFEQIVWKIREPFMTFSMLESSAIGNATFSSLNYYNLDDYEKQQGYDEIHPLVVIKKYAKSIKSNIFNVTDFAQYINKPIDLTQHLLMRLTVEGYISYNSRDDMVEVRDRAYYTIDARHGKHDYDVMKIPSVVYSPNKNATLNLANFDININGVNQIFLSDSQNVVIYPANGKIKLKKNRDFEFDGVVNAGLFNFTGNNLYFKYDSFKINLNNVDMMRINAKTENKDIYNNPILMRINNIIEKITGEILIDRPDNKSGLMSIPKYPVFISKTNSFIYYDDQAIHDGAYKRDKFYFEVYPYTINSIDNFNKDSLYFYGYFVSYDIFPSFKEQVHIMPDTSLGFVRPTPSDGFPIYGGKGDYYDNISLSNKGLRGQGKLTYLTSTVVSDDYLFLPDSTTTLASEFKIDKQKAGIEFPYVESQNIKINWRPYKNVMYVTQTKIPYKIFNENTTFNGDLTLKPIGLTGKGRLGFEGAEFKSNYFSYNADAFNSDSSSFLLYSGVKDSVLVAAENVNTYYNFLNKTGEFKTNEEIARIEFPMNIYVGFIEQFTWNGKDKVISMITEKKIHTIERGVTQVLPVSQYKGKTVGNHFISLRKSQDSLDFISPTAKYNILKRQIIADQVKLIEVADAFVYPSKGYVEVNEKAVMSTLQNAEIIANRDTKIHRFFNADVTVRGKYSYYGKGNYNYIDENGLNFIIHFENISVDRNIQTVADGVITEPDNFYLSPRFSFQGKVNLTANNEFLNFNGATKINHNCNFASNRWLRFETEIDPNNIFIPYPEKPRDINTEMLFSGDYITNDSIHVYTTFLGGRKNYSDNLMTPASGYLCYDKNRGEYVISSKEKILNRDTTGNLVTFNKDICILLGEGNLNFGTNFDHFKVNQFGTLSHDLEKETLRLNLLITLDFHFSDQALQIMADEIDSLPGSTPINMLSKSYNKRMNEFVGYNAAEELKDELLLYGTYRKLPPQFNSKIILSEVILKWNPETHSYKSEGKIGVAKIGDKQIHKALNGNIEIIKRRSGDIFHMYLNVDKNNWYFFSYSRGLMQSLSSNSEYNTILKETKTKHRKYNAPHSSVPYIYILATDEKFLKTLNYFNKTGEELPQEEESIDEEIDYFD